MPLASFSAIKRVSLRSVSSERIASELQSSVNSFGAIAVSGSAAAASIGTYVYAGVDAFQQTALNFTGQNIGANQYKRSKKVFLMCLGCVFVIGITI